MQNFTGRLTPHGGGDAQTATIMIDGQWLRLMQGHRRVGAWALEDVAVERVTVFRFNVTLDGATSTFAPDDPAGFADSVDVVVDLRPKSRFGLGERVRKAKEELAAAHAIADED
jgi:hypothetical protein